MCYKHAKRKNQREKKYKVYYKRKVQKCESILFSNMVVLDFILKLAIISIHEPTMNPLTVFKVSLLFIVIELSVKFDIHVNLDSDVQGHTNNFFFPL